MRVVSRWLAHQHLNSVRAVLFVIAMVTSSNLCVAGSAILSIDVPKDPFPKANPGGWGALVITWEQPVVTASFVFEPNCPTPSAGIADPAAQGNTWQLGPGKYGLLPTGMLVDPDEPKGPVYGQFVIMITFPDDKVPTIASAFWQSKPTPEGERTWTFNSAQDLQAQVDQFSVLPEPSTLVLALSAAPMLLVLARRRRTTS